MTPEQLETLKQYIDLRVELFHIKSNDIDNHIGGTKTMTDDLQNRIEAIETELTKTKQQ